MDEEVEVCHPRSTMAGVVADILHKKAPVSAMSRSIHDEKTNGSSEDYDIKCFHLPPQDSLLQEERSLQETATFAVLQLFNAVSKHQRQGDCNKTGVEKRNAKDLSSIDKRKFIGHLKDNDLMVEKDETKESSWKVLREDFVRNAKLKDWNVGEIMKPNTSSRHLSIN